MKRLKYLLIIGVLSLVTGCQNQSSIEEPVSEETNEPEQVIEETSEEESSDPFENSERIELSDRDFTFEYEDNTFSISSTWSDYVDALGYPDEYEENNYGYVNTNSDGYYWEMIYPSQSEFEFGFYVVFVSPSLERESEDTYVHHICLKQVETFRGIKAGDSISDLADAYGKPDSITVDEGNDEWSDITYTYQDYSIVFVVSDDKVLFVNMYDLYSETAAYTEFNYADVDTKGLSEETLDLFATCAIYLETGSNTDNGDMLSSKELYEIEEFLIWFINADNENVEFMHDYNGGADIPTIQWRIKYEDWECLLREVLNEKNPQNLRDKMSTEFAGEMEVYYNPDDNYIYMEVGAIGWGYEYAKVREVKTEGDTYVITYDLYSDLSDFQAPYSKVEVTITKADNKYGYTLVSVEEIEEYDAAKIRDILAKKYNCSESPFYVVFDHISDDGMYVYHIYESVVNETGSHIATIDWVYVDPKTGEATTFFDEQFSIEPYYY